MPGQQTMTVVLGLIGVDPPPVSILQRSAVRASEQQSLLCLGVVPVFVPPLLSSLLIVAFVVRLSPGR